MELRIGTPSASSVMPYLASRRTWPSAVAPPWDPMAGMTKGSPPALRTSRMMGGDNLPDVPDAPAAHRNTDAHPRAEPRRQPDAGKLAGESTVEVLDPAVVENLPDASHPDVFHLPVSFQARIKIPGVD